MADNENTEKTEVDGIFLQRVDGELVIEFKVDDVVHTLKLKNDNAMRLAESLQTMYLKSN